MKTGMISAIVIVFILLGDTYFRDIFHSIWLILSILFFIFLGVYHWMDRPKSYQPKKRDKEG